jgi:hypothetical protein
MDVRCGALPNVRFAPQEADVARYYAIALIKSRRRIAFAQAPHCADFVLKRVNYSRDLQSVEWGSEVSLQGSNSAPLMSALGHKRTLRLSRPMSALPPKADMDFAVFSRAVLSLRALVDSVSRMGSKVSRKPSDHRPFRNVSGTAVRDRDPPIRDYQ